MPTIEQRITALENATAGSDCRPLPLSYFYGEELPADFYTKPPAKRRTRAEFYAEATDTLNPA